METRGNIKRDEDYQLRRNASMTFDLKDCQKLLPRTLFLSTYPSETGFATYSYAQIFTVRLHLLSCCVFVASSLPAPSFTPWKCITPSVILGQRGRKPEQTTCRISLSCSYHLCRCWGFSMAASVDDRQPVPISKRPLDVFLCSFLLMNIPVVLLVESQVLLPSSLFPQALLDLVRWYVHLTGDYLVGGKPPFMKGLVFAEVLFQLPLIVSTSYAFIAGKDWGRITGIIFAAHVATTMFPIFGDFLATNIPTRNLLLGIYLPYIIIPFIMLMRLVPTEHPFTNPPSYLKVKKEE